MSTITDALKLEVSIVEALLNRNRTSHGRTIYYKRMQMVVQCIRKCTLLDFSERLEQHIKKGSKKDREWSTAGDATDIEQGYLKLALSTTFPQLISRIEHAAKALFAEIGRSFFLPYCAVAAAALARIRVLVQRLGQEGIVEMHKVGVDLTDKLKDYVADSEGNEEAQSKSTSNAVHLRLLAKSLGMSWKETGDQKTQKNVNVDNSVDLELDDEEPKQPQRKIDQQQVEVESDDEEDLGLHVGMDQKNPVVADQPERVDHNLAFVMETKKAVQKQKRKRGGEEAGKTKKSKKKKKKKKDVFDDIFGG
jgi:hypothetical protein